MIGSAAAELEDEDILRTASTPAELWEGMVLHDSGRYRDDPVEGGLALRRLHEAGQPGAGRTALVLLTAWRWRSVTSQLLGRLLGTGILTEEELDELAEVALFCDSARIRLPESAFGVPTHMSRTLQPPLRRWAAGQVLRSDPRRLAEVREPIGQLSHRDAGAAMTGVVDAVEVLPAELGDAVLAEASQWPHKAARTAALRRLAERGQYDQVAQRAQVDSDTSVRAAAAAALAESSTLF